MKQNFLVRTAVHSLPTVVLCSLAISCASTPVTHRKQLSLVPHSQMMAMGNQAFGEMKNKEKILNNEQVRAQVQKVGERIAKASGEKYDWEIQVFDEPKTVNAFCLPGGKIGVYSGILPIAKNEAGLAAILGHEVAHATADHAGERMSQILVAQAGLTLADVSLANQKYKNIIMGSMGLGAEFGVLLPYGRLQESEADTIGATYMAQAGYDPKEAIELWKRMAESSKGKNPPEFLSTHPDPDRRANDLEKRLPKFEEEYNKVDHQPSAPLILP